MISILIVDDQNIMRQGLQALLESSSKLKVVGTAEDGESAIRQIESLKPDITLIDIEMPGMSGITATQKICQEFPETKVIVLTSHEDKEYLKQALRAGAEGYLLKDTLAKNLEQTIYLVHQGHLQIESKLLKEVVVESSSNIAASSKQNGFVSITPPPTKFEANTDHLTKAFNSNSVLQQTIKKIENDRYKSSTQTKTNGFNLTAKTTKPTAKSLKTRKQKFKSRNLTGLKGSVNNKLTIVSTLLIIALTSIYFLNRFIPKSTSSVGQPKKVNVLPVKTTEIEPIKSYEISQTYTGEVEALQTSEVGFERGGKLIEVFVQEGDRVLANAPLAKLDTSNLEAQRQGLVAQQEQEKAILAELKNGARIEEVTAAQAEVMDIRQQLELEKLKNSRREYLYKEGAIAREQLDEIVFNRRSLNERLAGAKSSLEELQNGNRIEKVDAQQAAIDRLTAEIKDLDTTIDKSILRSPFNGMVSSRNLDEGTVVEPGMSILRMIENTQFKVKIGVPVAIADRMHLGSKQQVTIAEKEYEAKINSILPEVNTTTRSRTVVLELSPSAAIQVSPKQIARLKITQTKDADGYWLPINALTKGENGLWSCYALIELPNGNYKAERRYVESLETQNGRILVRGTLLPGDEIITDGVHRLTSGQLVRKN